MSQSAKVISIDPTAAIMDVRVDIVILASANYSNPQGDPDNENEPRVDPETGIGIITPAGYRRKVRDVGEMMGHPIFIRRKAVLASLIAEVVKNAGFDISEKDVGDDDAESTEAEVDEADDGEDKEKGKGKKGGDKAKKAKGYRFTPEDKEKIVRQYCTDFLDNMLFGGVITKPVNEGVTGPVQMSLALSVEPVQPLNLGIGRVAVTKVDDAYKERTLGRMSVVPFGLYRSYASCNPFMAQRTGCTWGHFNLFLEILQRMFDLTKSTTRFGMAMEKIVIFRHPNALGKASSKSLYERVQIERVNPTGEQKLPPARSMSDYKITINEEGLAEKGITVEVIEG